MSRFLCQTLRLGSNEWEVEYTLSSEDPGEFDYFSADGYDANGDFIGRLDFNDFTSDEQQQIRSALMPE